MIRGIRGAITITEDATMHDAVKALLGLKHRGVIVVDENKHILNCAYDSMGREEMKRFFATDFEGILRSIIDSIATESNLTIDENFKSFLVPFYMEALAGMLINYFQDREKHSRQELIDYMLLILRTSISAILKEKSADARND